MTSYRSPISPGLSWTEASCGERPRHARLDGARRADVAIVGGGYCGLSAAYHLARAGADVVLVDANRLGDGCSGRNGGQLSSGQRRSILWFEDRFGIETARSFWRMAEEAKAHIRTLIADHGIACDYTPGHIHALHKARFIDDAKREIEALSTRYGYDRQSFLRPAETAAALGSSHYVAAVRDTEAGHLHPMKFLIGLARAASGAGAALHEATPATEVRRAGGGVQIVTPRGTISAERALIATNAHGGSLSPATARHVMAIGSFIGATEPLPPDAPVLPGNECVADSRFVVRYFRKSADNRLIFGGREAYMGAGGGDIARHIGRQIGEVYPALADARLTHAWGGLVAITVPRVPFVREVMPGVISAAGFSGQGVALAPFIGKLVADAFGTDDAAADRSRLAPYEKLPVPRFPGGVLRQPLLTLALSYYALRDRL